VALGKQQLGNWWTAALEEGLLNHGDCLSPVEILMDPAQLRREPQPFNAWRPRGTLTPRTVPSETEIPDEVPLELGAILGFRQIEGLMLQLHSRFGDEDVTFLAFDARLFDEQREWRDPIARDRLLHLVSRALARAVEPDFVDQLEDEAPVARRA
jgi:hypothetical protein